ncbi:MAG: hypothetical protein KDC40_12335 [Actinobacteria bacterium]|nr:hypothetical protein [Actinomycetota bacterium]MCB0920280.1 hypothetical protein [Actinomycetota bacterium]HRY08345.1 hypothetical protein [Candidatus Nanopelagicales bacterium]
MTVNDRTRWRTVVGTAMATETTREQVLAAIHAGELPAIDIGGGALRISVVAATAWVTGQPPAPPATTVTTRAYDRRHP